MGSQVPKVREVLEVGLRPPAHFQSGIILQQVPGEFPAPSKWYEGKAEVNGLSIEPYQSVPAVYGTGNQLVGYNASSAGGG